jgi:hypothetical protein
MDINQSQQIFIFQNYIYLMKNMLLLIFLAVMLLIGCTTVGEMKMDNTEQDNQDNINLDDYSKAIFAKKINSNMFFIK